MEGENKDKQSDLVSEDDQSQSIEKSLQIIERREEQASRETRVFKLYS